MTIKHEFVSNIADSGADDLLKPSHWNADHYIMYPLVLGDIDNNITIEADGSIRLNGSGTAFDDMLGAITSIKVLGTGVSLNAEEQTIDFTPGANLGDYAWISYQLKHAWKKGSSIGPHIHWEQKSNAIPNFLIRYRWQANGQQKTTSWTDYKCTTTAFPYVSGVLNQICYGDALAPPAGYSMSDILQVRIYRDTTNASGIFSGADNYAGDASITSQDAHLELSQIGSRSEYVY